MYYEGAVGIGIMVCSSVVPSSNALIRIQVFYFIPINALHIQFPVSVADTLLVQSNKPV